jgi:hypothetical protein
MKRIAIILFLAQLFAAEILFADDNTFDNITHAVECCLPTDWKVLSVERDTVPRWSFSEDKCWLIKVFGPKMSGRRYYNKNGQFIGERRIYNEAIFIWIGDQHFDPRLSFLNRIKNRLSIVPQEMPKKIFQYAGFKVYAKEDLVVLPNNEPLWRHGMPGEHFSGYWDFEAGRSWPTWADDLERELKSTFSTPED